MAVLKEIEIKIPNLGEAESTEIIELSVKKGDRVKKNDPLLVLESEKAAMEVPSDHEGTIKDIKVSEGEAVKEGMVFMLLEITESDEDSPNKKEIEIPSNNQAKSIERENKQNKNIELNFKGINAGPAVRKFAREFDIDLTTISGTGRNGLITNLDIKNFIHASTNNTNYPDINQFKDFGTYEIKEQSKIRKLAAKNLHESWTTIPHVTHFEEIDITAAENQRKHLNEISSTKITPLSYVVYSVIEALKEMPIFNSSLVGEGKILLKEYINIGIAVDTPDGLVVPVVHNADKLNIGEIANSIRDLSEKAKTKKLFKKDLSGSNFTISSLGKIGGTGFTPIINPPEVAIIGVGRAKESLSYQNNEIKKAQLLPITLSYDHRVINGVDAGNFMLFIKNKLEYIDK